MKRKVRVTLLLVFTGVLICLLLGVAGVPILAQGEANRSNVNQGLSANRNPSRYGADDQIGAANLLTPEVVRRAVDLVREGRVYALGVEITPELRGPGGRQVIHTLVRNYDEPLAFVDDYVVGHLSVGTQIDGLGHGVVNGRSYNGIPAVENASLNALKRLGVENIPPFVTRGVLLDIAGYRGVSAMRPGDEITVADIEGASRRQNLTIRRGDVVLLHTGWMDAMMRQDPMRYVSVEPGLGVPAGEYLAAREVVAIGIDNAQMDNIPTPNTLRPVHEVLLTQNGVYIMENVNTSAIARDRAYEFLFVIGPIRYQGAAQTQVNPVAIR